MSFDDTVAPIVRAQRTAAVMALDDLAEAPDAGRAWRAWRSLERRWDTLDPAGRRLIKAIARARLPGSIDGRRRLAVVERLPD